MMRDVTLSVRTAIEVIDEDRVLKERAAVFEVAREVQEPGVWRVARGQTGIEQASTVSHQRRTAFQGTSPSFLVAWSPKVSQVSDWTREWTRPICHDLEDAGLS